MKLYPIAFASLISFVVAGMPQGVKALPFQPTCKGLQDYANALKWSVPTTFSNFQASSRFFEMDDVPNCMGYVTEKSPMGTKVCYGTINYNKSTRQLTWAADFTNMYGEKVGECKYR